MGEFIGKTILVTGAAQGFGRLAAQRFAEHGGHVVIGDIDETGLAETVRLITSAGGKVAARRCDVTEETDCQGLVELALATTNRLDIAVNNAGIVHELAKLPALSLKTFERVMAVNAGGVFLGMKYQLPAIERSGGGAIVNVASAAGIVGSPMLSVYAASKHAVVGLTRSAADEFARRKIRVNAVCPSFAATRMAEEGLAALGGNREDAIARMTSRVPMRRLATPTEVVEAILWLASDRSSFTTGQTLSVDGGLSAI